MIVNAKEENMEITNKWTSKNKNTNSFPTFETSYLMKKSRCQVTTIMIKSKEYNNKFPLEFSEIFKLN